MKVDVSVPEVGESVTQGVLTAWVKSDGELVQAGEELYELETDKITMSVPCEVSGRLHIQVPEGATVQIGQVVAEIDTQAADSLAPRTLPLDARPEEFPQAQPAEKKQAGQGPPISPPAGLPQAQTKLDRMQLGPLLSPAVRRLVQQHGLDPGVIHATGKGGRITKGDVLGHLESRSQMQTSTEPLKGLVRTEPHVLPAVAAASVDSARETRVSMSPLRHRITQRLVQVQQNAAILTTFNEADMSAVMAFRSKHKDKFHEKFDVRLGFMSFFVKAVVDALKTVPQLNARIEADQLVYQHYYDVGVAVSTQAGLVVPVVRGADQLGFAEIERQIADFAERARNRKLTLPELTGGCFTISNGGIYGSLLSTPILNPPQSGILGMHRIQKRPVVVDDQVVIRPMMYLALSYDHRIVDGAEAVTFLKRIVECLEDPERMLLEV